MPKEVYIPEFVDLDKLDIDGKKLTQKEKDKAAYLLSLVTINTLQLSLTEKLVFNFDPQADSRTYQGMVHDYKKYWKLFEKKGIIEVGKSYFTDEFSKSVLITDKPEYRPLLIKPHILSDIAIIKKLHQLKGKVNTAVDKKYPYLTRWFNDNLDIDIEAANKWLEENKSTDDAYNVHLSSVRQFYNKDYYFKTDKYGRLYTPICNIKRELRRFLTYNSQQIVSLDIRNSQPFLLGLILNPEFYRKENREKHIFNYWNLDPSIIAPLEPKQVVATGDGVVIEKTLNRLRTRKMKGEKQEANEREKRLSIYMLEETPHLIDNKDVNLYLKLTQSGKLYEYLIEQFNSIEPKKLYSRDSVKKKMMVILFSKDGDEWYDKLVKPKFDKLFPTVSKVIKQMKRVDYRNISHLLTNVESKLILDTICKDFARKHYRTPIFTIHDNIATTEPNVKMLLEFFTAKCEEVLGIVPPFKVEKWKDLSN